jgi:hypothetical protein
LERPCQNVLNGRQPARTTSETYIEQVAATYHDFRRFIYCVGSSKSLRSSFDIL